MPLPWGSGYDPTGHAVDHHRSRTAAGSRGRLPELTLTVRAPRQRGSVAEDRDTVRLPGKDPAHIVQRLPVRPENGSRSRPHLPRPVAHLPRAVRPPPDDRAVLAEREVVPFRRRHLDYLVEKPSPVERGHPARNVS